MRYENVLEAIGNTPLIRLNRLAKGLKPRIYVKAEFMNPGGSVKDRIGVAMIDEAERKGLLKPGGTIVEGTSGNTGIALALVAALRGYKLIFTITDKQSREKINLLKALGAEVIVCPTAVEPEDPRSYYCVADKLTAEVPNAYHPNQYENPDNVRAHYETTGPEIWAQTEGRVTHFFAGYGTCGTLTGVARYLKERNPAIKVVAVEPQRGHRLPGLKNLSESRPPGIFEPQLVDDVVRVDDGPAYAMTKRLYREEGLMVGPSTGAIVHAATTWDPGRTGVSVAIAPDGGLKYGSFFAEVLGDEGLPSA